MTRRIHYAIGLLALQACSSGAGSSDDSPAKPQISAESRDDLERTLDDIVRSGVAPGVALSVELPGHAIWSGASGVGDVETGEPLVPERRFRGGSMVKSAVAVAVLQLVENDELSLDAKLTQVLPAAVSGRITNASTITLRMLLDHTSGIPEFSTPEFEATVASDPMHVWTLNELLDWALTGEPLFPPGTGWSYSNTDYILLGEVIAHHTGGPWRDAIRNNVFARAGLEHMTLPEEGNPLCDGCTRGYLPIEGGLWDVTEVDPSMAGAAGGHALIARPDQLVMFMRTLVSGELFDDPATLALMLDFVDAENPDEAQTGYGLGLQRFQIDNVEIVGHLGGTAGFQGFVIHDPETDIVASGYMNQNGDFGAFFLSAFDAVKRVH